VDQPQFEALVERMARLAQRSPRLYRWRVYALAVFGFASLAVLVLALVALLVIAIALMRHGTFAVAKLVWLIGALLVVVLRALWVRLQSPEGEPLLRHDAPALFALLDRLRSRLDTPAVHHVLVTDDFNAAVTQVPRLGVFGWHRNYLLIGLPLLRSLSVPQLEAVLAHELGHLSRGHARAGNWIYRLRLTWHRLDKALASKPRWGSGAIRSFLQWYVPYFNACSFPLARNQEFEADAASSRLTSPQAAAQALTNVSVIASYLNDRYWPAIHAAARDRAQPAFGPFSGFQTPAADQLFDPVDAQRWLTAALSRPTTYADTHPCLKERLQALGAEAQFALPTVEQAADRLLGERSAGLAQMFDLRWCARVQDSWKQVYENAQKRRARLTELRTQAAQEPLTTEQGVELASLEEDVGEGAARALTLRRELVARYPESPLARFVLARQLLLQADETGVPLMESVIAVEPDAMLAGCELLRDYCWRRGQRENAGLWHERALERARVVQETKEERERLRVGDRWLGHGLDAPTLRSLVERLRQIQGLRRAYLVRKQVKHRADLPLYVLGFSVTTFGFTGNARTQAVMEELRSAVQFPGETLIINIEGVNRAFAREFAAAPDARII